MDTCFLGGSSSLSQHVQCQGSRGILCHARSWCDDVTSIAPGKGQNLRPGVRDIEISLKSPNSELRQVPRNLQVWQVASGIFNMACSEVHGNPTTKWEILFEGRWISVHKVSLLLALASGDVEYQGCLGDIYDTGVVSVSDSICSDVSCYLH